MRTLALVALLSAVGGACSAEEREPFPARTTPWVIPALHTHERTHTVNPVGGHAVPGKSQYESGGYVGGGKLVHGEGRGTTDGTFGWDYTGFGRRPGRFFLGWFNNDSSKQGTLLPRYNSDGPRVTDVFALQPYKKAIREAKAEKHGGGEKDE